MSKKRNMNAVEMLFHVISVGSRVMCSYVQRGPTPLPLPFKLTPPPFLKKGSTPQSVSSSPIFFSQIILHTLKDTLILLDLLQSPLCLTFWRFFSLWCIIFSENPVKEAYFFLSLSFLPPRLHFDILYFSSCLSTSYNYTKLFLFLFL